MLLIPLFNAYVFVCLLKIGLFICFNHQLMKYNDIGVGQTFDRLYTETHDRAAIFDYLDIALRSWHTIHTLWFGRAWNLKIASPY